MKVNISIDDISPHPKSSVEVLNNCQELIRDFPEIKFSLFVPISYWRTTRDDLKTQQPLEINKFPDFCAVISNLPDKNYEICYHGLYHGIPGITDNDEFQNLTYDQAIEKFKKMYALVEEAGLQDKFKPIFRPPAWRMSPAAFDAAEAVGIELLALSPKDYAQKIYDNKDKTDFWKDRVVYYHSNPPFDELKQRHKLEIVYHACQWDKNYLNSNMTKNLRNFLLSTNDVEFCFISDLRD